MKLLEHRYVPAAAAFFTTALACAAASAGVVIGPVSISSPQGDFGGSTPLINIINQSSLSAAYTSGVTDFSTYTAATTAGGLTGAGFTATSTNGPQQFSFDLGAVYAIDAIGLWQSGSAGAVTQFELYADDDSNFANGGLTSILGLTNLGQGTANAQVFNFASAQTRYVHFSGLASLAPPDFYGMNEIIFSGSRAALVPEPGTLALAGLGLLMLARRRR